MNTKIYIGTDQLDFNEEINLVYGIGSITNFSIGSNNKSYTINLPLTKTNKRILKYANILTSKQEITSEGRIYINGSEVLRGTVRVLSTADTSIKIIIDSDDWLTTIENTKLKDVGALSTEAVSFTAANVSGSWISADPFIRFGMIFFAEMWSGVRGYWETHDFIPMFSVVQMMTKIMAPYTITSAWLATAYAKKLFFLGVEPRQATDFINDKALSVSPTNSSENTDAWAIGATTRDQKVITYDPVSHNTETTDEGSDYNTTTDLYTIPETGTYRIQWKSISWVTNLTSGSITIHNLDVTKEIQVYYAAGGSATLAQYQVLTSTTAADVDGHDVTLDTGYIHLTVGDTIRGYFDVDFDLENTSGGSITITTYIEGGVTKTILSNVLNYRNLYTGLNKSINPVDYMPDVSALDFLKAIKQACNLRFFMDKRNGTVHIEPADSFFTNNDIDISDYVINLEDIVSEEISHIYKNKFILQWREDTRDKAYKEYIESADVPYQKTVTLSSLYTRGGEDKYENPIFASTVIRNAYSKPYNLPCIFGNEDYVGTAWNQLYPLQRAVGYTPRILTWEGMTAAGLTWYYNNVGDTDYPKVAPIDFTTLYASYYLKTFHYIDKGRSITLKVKMTPVMLSQFMGQVATAASEGFRARYKVWTGQEYIYLSLEEMTTNGDIAEWKCILKQ